MCCQFRRRNAWGFPRISPCMSVFRVFRIETFNDENLFEQNFNELLGLSVVAAGVALCLPEGALTVRPKIVWPTRRRL
jgi:hypothetical protein